MPPSIIVSTTIKTAKFVNVIVMDWFYEIKLFRKDRNFYANYMSDCLTYVSDSHKKGVHFDEMDTFFVYII